MKYDSDIRFKNERVFLSEPEIKARETAGNLQKKAIKYMERINNPDAFFAKQREDEMKRKGFSPFAKLFKKRKGA